MKRGMDKKKFATEIRKAIYLLNDNEIREKIIIRLTDKGYNKGIASDIVEGNALLETFSTTELGVIADILHKVGNISSVAIDKFLEEAEIDIVKNHRIKQEDDDKDLLVFEDVRKVADDIWTVVVPCQKIAQLYRANAVGYDFETQRDPKLVEVGDKIVKEANVNDNAVADIKDLLIKGLFIPNTITFNVPIEYSEDLKFDEKEKRIVILNNKALKIVDGFHRCLGIIGALRDKPDLGYNFEMRITNFTTDKARQFIVQEDKRNPINKEYIKSIDKTDLITVMVNKLNQDSTSELRGKITTDSSVIASGNALVGFDIMHSTMSKLWKPATSISAENTADYLIEFFNRLVDAYPNELKFHIKESRKFSHINSQPMFVLYLALAKAIEGKEGWKTIFYKTLSSIDIENEMINEFVNTPPSTIRHGINNHIKIANNIIEGVLGNER